LAAPAKPFSWPGEGILKPESTIKDLDQQRGSVMLSFIIGLVYRQYCKSSLTGMRRHRCNSATAG
jgi:hypothetical protein